MNRELTAQCLHFIFLFTQPPSHPGSDKVSICSVKQPEVVFLFHFDEEEKEEEEGAQVVFPLLPVYKVPTEPY